MAITVVTSFPATPTAGDQVEYQGVIYEWDGGAWVGGVDPTYSQADEHVQGLVEFAEPNEIVAGTKNVAIDPEDLRNELGKFIGDYDTTRSYSKNHYCVEGNYLYRYISNTPSTKGETPSSNIVANPTNPAWERFGTNIFIEPVTPTYPKREGDLWFDSSKGCMFIAVKDKNNVIVWLDTDGRTSSGGTPEYIGLYDNTTTYGINDLAYAGGKIYKSLVAANLGNALTDAASWEEFSAGSKTALVNDPTAAQTIEGTPSTNLVLKEGATQAGSVLEVQDAAGVAKFGVDANGDIKANNAVIGNPTKDQDITGGFKLTNDGAIEGKSLKATSTATGVVISNASGFEVDKDGNVKGKLLESTATGTDEAFKAGSNFIVKADGKVDATGKITSSGAASGLVVNDGTGDTFTVDEKGHVKGLDSTRGATSSWYELNSIGTIQVQRHSSTAGAGNGSLVARFTSGGAGATAADVANAVIQANHLADIADSDNQYLISCRTGLTAFNDASPTNTKFSVKGDGSLLAASNKFGVDANGHIGVRAAAQSWCDVYIDRPASDTTTNSQLFISDERTTLNETGDANTDSASIKIQKAVTPNPENFNFITAKEAANVKFNVKGDGSGYFAGAVGIGTPPTLGLRVRSNVATVVHSDPSKYTGGSNQAAAFGFSNHSTKRTMGLKGSITSANVAGSSVIYNHAGVSAAGVTDKYMLVSGDSSVNRITIDLAGNIKNHSTASQAITVISDPRLKTPFTPSTYELSHIAQVTVGHYSRLDDPDSVEQLGHDAASLHAVAPHCVTLTDEPVPEHADLYYDDVEVPYQDEEDHNEDGSVNAVMRTRKERQRNDVPLDPEHAIKGVNIGNLMALHTQMIQQLTTKIEALESEVAKLKKK